MLETEQYVLQSLSVLLHIALERKLRYQEVKSLTLVWVKITTYHKPVSTYKRENDKQGLLGAACGNSVRAFFWSGRQDGAGGEILRFYCQTNFRKGCKNLLSEAVLKFQQHIESA